MTLQLMNPDFEKIIYYTPPERKMLAGVKTGIYNPYMTSLKTNAINDQLSRMPWEHTRTTVPGYVDKISQENVFHLYDSPVMTCQGFFSLPQDMKDYRDESQVKLFNPSSMTQGKLWRKRRIPLKQYRVVNIPVVSDYSFCNYGVSAVKPELKQQWRDYIDINPNAPKKLLQNVPIRK